MREPYDATVLINGYVGRLVNTGCIKVKMDEFGATELDKSVTSVISSLNGQSLTSDESNEITSSGSPPKYDASDIVGLFQS